MELDVLGIPKNKIKQLNDAGIFAIEDIVKYLPRKYYDFRIPKVIKEVKDGDMCSIIGNVEQVVENGNMIYARIKDDTGYIKAYWFHQAHIKRFLKEGQRYIFCGKIQIDPKYGKKIMPVRFDMNINKLKKMIPVYKKIAGMSDEYLISLIEKSLFLVDTQDFLEDNIKKQFELIGEYDAFKFMHKPLSPDDVEKAKYRFAFDDLFLFNFQLKKSQQKIDKSTKHKVSACQSWHTLYKNLPFDLTDDQKITLKRIYAQMKGGQRVNCLVQGDVGSGKTIVAVFLMMLCAEHGIQSCLMAPTEILARQHYEEILKSLKDLPYQVGFLSGNVKAKEKKQTLAKIGSGEIQIIVGTHAVIQNDVEYNNLGMLIVDEQHRFGVVQREALTNKCKDKPHSVVMSATPIPRTLSMALYGDTVDVLTIKTRPKGRKPIITKQLNNDVQVNQFMLDEIKKGRQCYVVCPLVEDSESEIMADVESVNTVYDNLNKYFNKQAVGIKIGMITGKMKQSEIDEEIGRFARNETQILVATTIVEVGVNVPNSTVITIKNAERFGLAQLHQLRGRVGRGEYQSYCILQSAKEEQKVDIMCSTTDGFEIAQKDLELRGPGDFLGTQQSGNNKYVMLMIAYAELYEKINKLNNQIYADPQWYARYSFINDFELL